MTKTRRDFIKMGTLAGSGLLLGPLPPVLHGRIETPYAGNALMETSYALLQKWGEGLLALQLGRPGMKTLHGGFLCPACSTIHGRSGDAVFPLLLLAEQTKDEKYLKAALDVYEWMESSVSAPDGSWMNEVSVSAWKGTTVFAATALAEAVQHFGHLVDGATRKRWMARLDKAAGYLYKTFTIKTGNINYPIAGSYALSLTGSLLHRQEYMDRGRALAHECLGYITKNDALIYGEGHPLQEPSAKGCYSVDLGYNVEESLPSLVLYGRLNNDQELLDRVAQSLRAHLEFMLPDGAWDNSWGTRNFKWTWWGSRTSDGCQPAYALMADRDPVFYTAALQNTLLLDACTHNNLLHGGPHYASHGVLPCVHHTFSHSKALATILTRQDSWKDITAPPSVLLPRAKEYGIKAFKDIHTWLLSAAGWRATVTGYDQEYSIKNGHASGGALTLLWHIRTGPLITAGMNSYQMVEPFNMQRDDDPQSMCLTPRFEWMGADGPYMNISDLKAEVRTRDTAGELVIHSSSQLVNEHQQAPPFPAACELQYIFTKERFTLRGACAAPAGKARFVLPLIATAGEKVTLAAANKLVIQKQGAVVTVESKTSLLPLTGTDKRIFNFVPGMEAFPVALESGHIEISISIS